jgi:outer membrane protein TolC
LRRLRNLLAAGQTTPLDTLEFANHRLELQTSLAANRHQRSILLAQMEELAGLAFEPAPAAEDPTVLPVDPDGFAAQALTDRPEFAVNAARQEQAAQMRTAALSNLYPQVYANAEYHYGIPGVQVVNPKWDDYYTVGVSAQWCPWDWGQTREKARVAELNRKQLECDRDRLTAQVRREVYEAAEQMNSLAERIHLQNELAAQENLRRDQFQRKYEQGQSTALDLRDAESRATEAECTLARLYAQWEEVRYQLLYVSGTLGGDR